MARVALRGRGTGAGVEVTASGGDGVWFQDIPDRCLKSC